MLSKSPNFIAISQLIQTAIYVWFFLCCVRKKPCGSVTKCSTHHRNYSIIFLEKVLKGKKHLFPMFVMLGMKCKWGSGLWQEPLLSLWQQCWDRASIWGHLGVEQHGQGLQCCMCATPALGEGSSLSAPSWHHGHRSTCMARWNMDFLSLFIHL